MDGLQGLTHALSYMFSQATKAVNRILRLVGAIGASTVEYGKMH